MLKALILQGRGKLVLLSIVLALVTVALGCDHSDQVYPNLEILTPQERAWLEALDRPIRIGPDPNFPRLSFSMMKAFTRVWFKSTSGGLKKF